MAIKCFQNEEQIQMSDAIYNKINTYMELHNMTLSDFSKAVKFDEFVLGKIIDRKIKMHCYKSLIYRLIKFIESN